MSTKHESRAALRTLISLLEEIDSRWLGEEWGIGTAADEAQSARALMHMLEGGLLMNFEQDARAPDFRRMVSPTRKFTGDNSDTVFYDAPISPDYSYKVQGNVAGVVYFSVTIEENAADGSFASNIAGVISDDKIDIDDDGNFILHLGGQAQARNWLALTPNAGRITVRCYYEERQVAGANPMIEPRLQISCLDADGKPGLPSDASVAAGINRVCNFVRDRTLGVPRMQDDEQPAFVSKVPNQFPPPVLPGDFRASAAETHYSLAPWLLQPDEALIITGRWPQCRYGSINLWNMQQQTLDYANHQVTLNRNQTTLEEDGSFKMIVAHEDPKQPNWLNTQGLALGMMFFRFILADGEVETPQTTVVKLQELLNE